MDIVQVFDTTIVDRDQGFRFRVFSIPKPALPGRVDVREIFETLEIVDSVPITGAELFNAVLSIIGMAEFEDSFEISSAPDSMLAFAEQISFSDLIPVQESPLKNVSLASRVAGYAANPVAMGAFIGVVSVGHSPFLLLSVPTGIILCGAAVSFARVIDKQLDALIGRLVHRPWEKQQNKRVRAGDDAEGLAKRLRRLTERGR